MADIVAKTKRLKPTKAHCPTCDGGDRTCDIHGTVYIPWTWEDRIGNTVSGGVTHSLLQCRGCETVFYEIDSWDTEDRDMWHGPSGELCGENIHTKATYPKPESRTKPIWLSAILKQDEELHAILNEMYVAYDNQAFILTAIGLRTALDRGTAKLGIEAALTFEEKLKRLQTTGVIGETERRILEVVTNAGNAAAHQGWAPTAQQLRQLLSALEVFLQRAFVYGQNTLALKDKIPAKQRRPKVSVVATPTQVETAEGIVQPTKT
ncbi:DUF4145 domain-containing protein [Cereibacter changlensis]|nr:DUF4145 domain-containing protein [Cereibacter changlensis]